MSKILTLVVCFFLCLTSAVAQMDSSFRLAIDGGYIAFSGSNNLGLYLNVEPKIKSSKRTVIGLRIGVAINSQSFENENDARFKIDEEFDNGFLSFVPTCDYYFSIAETRPYLGLGIGVYSVANYLDVHRFVRDNSNERIIEVKVGEQLGALLRAGVEIRRMRLGLEYNFIPRTKIESPEGETIGKVRSGYFGLSFGYIIGK